ncbi:MAG: oligosaccharide flippase family protein [Thermoleophilaceae bacterium]
MHARPEDVTPGPRPRRHLGLGALSSAAAQVLGMAATFVLSVVIARRLGPSGNGTYALAANLFEIALVLSTVGLATGVIYLVSRGDWPVRAALKQTQAAALVLGAIGGAGAAAFYLLTRHNVLEGLSPTAALLVLAALPFGIGWGVSSKIALGRERYELYATTSVVQPAAALVLGGVLLFPFGVTGALTGYALGHVLAALLTAYWVRGLVDDPSARSAPRRQLRTAAAFGAKSWGAELFQLLNYRLDLFILSAYASRSDVGVYAVALSLTAVGWVLPAALQTVVFPRTAGLDAEVTRANLPRESSDTAVARASRHTVLLLGPTALGLALLVAIVVPVFYGPRFTDATLLGFVLIPGVVLLGVGKVLNAATLGRGFPIYSFYTMLVALPLTVAMYLLLIPPLHAYGAALASTVSYSLTAVMSLLFFGRATGVAWRAALVPTRADARDLVEAMRAARSAAMARLPRRSARQG